MKIYKTQRIGWLRATVLGANDGSVSTASLRHGPTSFTLKIGGCWMKRGILITLVAFAEVANGQTMPPIGEIPTEDDCLAYIAILPTFHSEKMKFFYEKNPKASGKELVERIQSLADRGDKDLQYTYSQLLLNGYCVPKDVCAARWYLERSRGGPNNWEQVYPIQPLPKETEARCNSSRSSPTK